MSVQINPTVEYKQPINYSKSNPETNEYYTVGTLTLPELYQMRIIHANDETDAKTIEVKLTIDGFELVGTFDCLNNTSYFLYRSLIDDTLVFTTSTCNLAYYSPIHGHSIVIEYRFTEEAGTNETFLFDVYYGEASEGTYWWYKHYETEYHSVSPVNGTELSLLDAKEDVNVIYMSAIQSTDEADAKSIIAYDITEGVESTDAESYASGTLYRYHIYYWIQILIRLNSLYNGARYTTLQCQDLEAYLKFNNDPSTNQTLNTYSVYELYEEVS